jgi:hypothetical protein
MSRGLGTLQREILRTCETLVAAQSGQPHSQMVYRDDAGYQHDASQICAVGRVQREVAKARGWWCEHDCYKDIPAMVRPRGPHRPHVTWEAKTASFCAAFARALRTLIGRNLLVPVAVDMVTAIRRTMPPDQATALLATLPKRDKTVRVGVGYRVRMVALISVKVGI